MTRHTLRIVLDTNVYISAALFGKQAETILQLASGSRLTLITSETILAELEEKLRDKLHWHENRIVLFLETLRDFAEIVAPDFALDAVPGDPDDNRVLECAVAGNADLIVTSDKDLLRLKSHGMIGIITPPQLNFYGLVEE